MRLLRKQKVIMRNQKRKELSNQFMSVLLNMHLLSNILDEFHVTQYVIMRWKGSESNSR